MQTNKDPLEKLYEQLPENVQEAISSVAVSEKLQEIAKRNDLHIDEAGIVSDEVTMVMLGIENPKDFVDELQNKLKLPREKVVKLAKDVDKEIFETIRESLRKMYESEEEDNETMKQLSNESIVPINEEGSIKKELTAEELNQKLVEEDKIFKNKTEGVVNLPREEIVLEQNNSPKIESKIKHIDPYREPSE